jgi:hypothetical protein
LLEQENHELRRRDDGDRFKPTDTARDIARVIVGMFSPTKARAIAGEIQTILKEQQSATKGVIPC